MWIYVISQHDMESSSIHSAYEDEDEVKIAVGRLNKMQDEQKLVYGEWVERLNDEEECPDFEDYTFTYNKTWLK